MSAIRPDMPGLPTAAAVVPAPVSSAQAAFFRAALEGIRSAQPASPEPDRAAAARTTVTEPAQGNIARPGSLLDIRV